ncbi:MAG: 3-dehydroquinate synthase [Paludibacter sp.]|nr:3-dehydroquinate synthase [Paludibacter sp.]MDD4198352.1 3-dehydroquinate synthase [Paludibacter sp.]MDD4428328.1 3-dehydroquinate synthase [Paludibacter sp.]
MNRQLTTICTDIKTAINDVVGDHKKANVFILTDDNSLKYCYPLIRDLPCLKEAHLITIASGDENKNIDSAVKVWQYLSEHDANRKSLMINLGGGMITDIGGFVASTFKRGIEYINIPTTLLGAVDAATGGKTGINFLGLKNEIGVFNPARHVLIYIDFFKTLDKQNLRSGYAEMVKHALIDAWEEWRKVLDFNLEDVDFDVLRTMVERSVRIKERIVEQDPKEQHLRKALNLGHTFAHAFETFSYRVNRPVLHGYAVMWGLLCELYLAHVKFGFPKKELLKLKYMTKEYYGMFSFDCNDYEILYELMTHDKKNESKEINFTLLSDIGEIQINQTASKEEIFEVLDFYLMG